MAGHHDCDRVAIVGHAHGAKRVWLADGAGDVRIGASLAVRNCQQGAPAGQLEIRAAKIERESELAPFAGEIFFEFVHVRLHLARRIFECEALLFFAKMARVRANRLLAGQPGVEFQGDQSWLEAARNSGPIADSMFVQ